MTDTEKIADVVVAAVRVSTKVMADDMAAMQTRMATMEAMQSAMVAQMATMSDRMESCEADMTACKGRMAQMQDEMAAMQGVGKSLAVLDGRVQELSTRSAIPGPPGERGPAGDAGPQGEHGTSVDIGDVRQMVQEAVADIPPPKDGRDGTSVTAADVAPLIASEVEKAVSALPAPKDGIGLLSALIDREGELVVTLSDGTTKQLGPVVGRDVDMREVERLITEKVALIPVKEGAPGKNGRDGTLEGASIKQIDERTFRFLRADGSVLGEMKSSAMVYRGVFRSGDVYEKGDAVTRNGSLWIARDDTQATPGDGVTSWQLAAKAGRDGKGLPGERGPQGAKGEKGEPGRNFS
jgi:hypothetical protein